MKYSFLRSIRSQLLLLVLISVPPALGIALYSGFERETHEIEEAQDNAVRVVQSLSYDHKLAEESTRQFLTVISQIPAIRDLNVSAGNKILGKMLKQNPLYASLFVINSEGILWSSALPFRRQSVKDRKYFRDAKNTKDFSVGEYVISITAQLPVLHFSYPIIDAQGRFKGVVGVAFGLTRYGHIFQKTKLPEGSTLSLFDHGHTRLYSNHDDKKIGTKDSPEMIKHMSAQPEEGTFASAGDDGVKRLYAYKKVYISGSVPYLFIRVGIPQKYAILPARKALAISTAFLGLGLIISVASAWFIGNIILVRRLNRLVDASERLGHGDLRTRTGLSHREDELGRLTRAFDQMATELEQKEIQRRAIEEALRLSEENYRAIFENAAEGICQVLPEGRFASLNPTMARIYGYSSPEDMMASVTDIRKQLYVDPEERTKYRDLLEKYGAATNFETRSPKKDGTIIWVSLSSRVRKDASGNILYFDTMVEDVTRRKETEDLLSESEERYRTVTEKSIVGVSIIQDGLFRYVNEALANVYGYKPDEMVDKINPLEVALPEDRPLIVENVKRRLSGQVDSVHYEVRIRRKDGAIRYVEVFGAVATYKGAPAIFGTALDITEKKELQERLITMSIIDELTGLYNRRGFFALAHQQFKLSERDLRGMILFFADLDDMKRINDTLGHKEGDRALIEMARILRQTFRESDIIGRIGGDEFAILAIDATDDTKEALITRLQNILDNYNRTGAGRYTLSLSIGAARYDPENRASLDELITRADALMYETKRSKQV